jgi:hypothetical protein
MSALRQRAALLARRSRPTAPRNARFYASDKGPDKHHDEHHDEHHHEEHHAPPPQPERLGVRVFLSVNIRTNSNRKQTAFFVALGAVPASIFFYTISRPDADGKPKGISSLIGKYTDMADTWKERNELRTAMIEQACHDKHLLYNAPRNKHIELKFPEYASFFNIISLF